MLLVEYIYSPIIAYLFSLFIWKLVVVVNYDVVVVASKIPKKSRKLISIY